MFGPLYTLSSTFQVLAVLEVRLLPNAIQYFKSLNTCHAGKSVLLQYTFSA